MAMFGPDWRLARAGWLYPTERLQNFWRAIGITAVLLLGNYALQSLLGVLVFAFALQGTFEGFMSGQPAMVAKVAQSAILVIFPASLVTLFLGWRLAKFGLPHRKGRLLLNWPKLGWLGWVSLVLGFTVTMFIVLNVVMRTIGVDPNISGLVEKTMADMAANQPWLFAWAIPSVIFGAPLAEEIMFRGPLFSALVKSPVGKVGAVLISAALWAGVHAGAAPLVFLGLIFLMGIVLGLLLLRFGSLWVTIVCHLAWNLIQALGILAAGLTR